MIFADTHVLVWLANGSKRLPAAARELLMTETRIGVNAVIAWEYADLRERGRLNGSPSLDEIVSELSLELVNLPAGVWQLARSLPRVHQDPVDRMLIAHAMLEDGTIASADENVRRYPAKFLW